MTSADDAELESYIASLEGFFDCANDTAAGRGAEQLEAAFKMLQTTLEDLIMSETPFDQL